LSVRLGSENSLEKLYVTLLGLDVKKADLVHDVCLIPGSFGSVSSDFDFHSEWHGEDEEGSVILQ